MSRFPSSSRGLTCPRIPGLNFHMVRRWLNSFPSVQTARTRWGLARVTLEVYDSTTGGNPTIRMEVKLKLTEITMRQDEIFNNKS
ncbi:hypothetical protein E2C01_005869 [Portunus trituberculatus]|uniref:Uncharacterized protein n=1 Tax=Portunus trituberculatus TaxID=210409 RepID=A0A5B7CUK5_PORTR|nr:hypothetical protein [Portunus trituberculatus]